MRPRSKAARLARMTSATTSAVRDNKALSRFELEENGVTAFANYQLGDGVITISHTETPVAARGRGIASRLVAGALAIARARGLKVIPRCPFVRAYVQKHPEVSDLLA
jgi:predicted GNAT family acetyltransferase